MESRRQTKITGVYVDARVLIVTHILHKRCKSLNVYTIRDKLKLVRLQYTIDNALKPRGSDRTDHTDIILLLYRQLVTHG